MLIEWKDFGCIGAATHPRRPFFLVDSRYYFETLYTSIVWLTHWHVRALDTIWCHFGWLTLWMAAWRNRKPRDQFSSGHWPSKINCMQSRSSGATCNERYIRKSADPLSGCEWWSTDCCDYQLDGTLIVTWLIDCAFRTSILDSQRAWKKENPEIKDKWLSLRLPPHHWFCSLVVDDLYKHAGLCRRHFHKSVP